MAPPIPPELVRAQASALHGIELAPARTCEVAAELDALLRGTAVAAEGSDFLADPEDLRSVLWELRERAP